MENPVVPPFLRNIPNPPPNPRLNDPGHSVLTPPPLLFKILWRMKISILALSILASKYLKMNFLSELIHAGNNLSL